MPYTIHLTNGNVLTTIPDETADGKTNLTLLGKNYAGYGAILAENFVHILENAASTSPPDAPLVGQLWYNTSGKTLNVWTGTAWQVAGIPPSGTVINQSITISGTTAQNVGIVITDPSAPANSKYYRMRVRDDGVYAGHWVLEALNDNLTIKTVVLDTTNLGAIKLAVTPAATDNTTAIATTAFVKNQIATMTSANITTALGYTPVQNVVTSLGYTPVQQGGGKGQKTNKLYLGWDGTGLKLQVDVTDLGYLTIGGAKQADINTAVALRVAKAGDTMSGNLNFSGGASIGLTSGVIYANNYRGVLDTDSGFGYGGDGILNFYCNGVTAVAFRTTGQINTAKYGFLENYFLPQTGGTVTGDLKSNTGMYGTFFRFNGDTDTGIQSGGDGDLTVLVDSVGQAIFRNTGRIWTRVYGWLDEAFAQRGTVLGMGYPNVYGACGNKPSASGYEVFDADSGKHQIRAWTQNCYDCNCDCAANCACVCDCDTGNCNCASNCDCLCGSCFPPYAKVIMADGSEKPIADIRVGEFVMGRYGEANEVIAKEYPPLGPNRPMYRINREHWTTDEHPHFTRDGIASVEPDKYFLVDVGLWWEVELADGSNETWLNRGLPDAKFVTLQVGMDLCYRRAYKKVELIEADHSWPADYKLYNLVLGGSHTYHVDGYLVTGWPQDIDFDYETWTPTGAVYVIPKKG